MDDAVAAAMEIQTPPSGHGGPTKPSATAEGAGATNDRVRSEERGPR